MIGKHDALLICKKTKWYTKNYLKRQCIHPICAGFPTANSESIQQKYKTQQKCLPAPRFKVGRLSGGSDFTSERTSLNYHANFSLKILWKWYRFWKFSGFGDFMRLGWSNFDSLRCPQGERGNGVTYQTPSPIFFCGGGVYLRVVRVSI